MNSVIIYTIQQRSSLLRRGSRTQGQSQGQSQGQGQNDFKNIKMKKSERQIYIMLLLVTFAFLFLATPFYIWAFLLNFYKSTSPRHRAGLVLLQSVASAAMYVNCGINFFLYVVSGQKFRADLMNLFSRCRSQKHTDPIFTIENVTKETDSFTLASQNTE